MRVAVERRRPGGRRGVWWPAWAFGPTSAVVGKFMPSCTASSVPFAGAETDHPVDPPGARLGAGGGVLDLLDRGEVRAVRHREPGGLDGRELTGLPERLERGHRRVQPEHRVLAQQRGRGHGGRRTRLVVAGVAVGYDDAEAVDAAAQADHDHGVAARGAGEGRLHHARRRTSGSRPCRRRRPRHPGAGERRETRERAKSLQQRAVGAWRGRSSGPHVVMWSGESSRAMASRGNIQLGHRRASA